MMIRKPPVRLLLGFEFMARRRDRRGLPGVDPTMPRDPESTS